MILRSQYFKFHKFDTDVAVEYYSNSWPLFMAKKEKNLFYFLLVCLPMEPPVIFLVTITVWHAHCHTLSFSCLHHLHSSFPPPSPPPPRRHNGPVQSDPYLPNNMRLWKDPYRVAANAPVGPREWKMLPAETAWVSGPSEQKAVQSSERKGERGDGGGGWWRGTVQSVSAHTETVASEGVDLN